MTSPTSYPGHINDPKDVAQHARASWDLPPVWKRDKNILYLGSVHTADLAEVYGITGDDHLGTDALINFINHQDPNYPKGSTASSLLSKIAWPKYTVDSKQMLLFSDNATEEYTTIPDTYRAMLFGLYKN
ncbi:hypothetical protein BJ322DRAFT_1105578 [Thelephora terrestris]|uniref:Uncharacterized protein n=1 Tax=Thelephora terrestris TaxID=56493 RepID=A0A9P6LAC4_9AGAM|nr:hypothetical protein BJ322DRAFT_1105578 [Thelephora terrestris]